MGDILDDDRELPENNQPPPSQVLSPVWIAVSFLEQYGWIVLFGVIIVYVVWKRFEPKYRLWQEKKREREEFLNTDPAVLEQRQMGLLASREKMQQKYQEQSDIAAKERKEREDAKVQQKIEAWDNLSGWGPGQSLTSNKSASAPSSKPAPKKSQFRRDNYNPLMGHGGGAGYRPSRKFASGGG
ncbi:selenoprotein S-like [Dysidea avara]|uniref:selenoprotein S-like n=1 Tax=Dysidea avara TaxID=196820 RepID=UPI0033343506